MVTPTAGAVVLVPFPFSDLSQAKLRPAVGLADVDREDWILCQVTSNPYGDTRTIMLEDASFAVGGLRVVSYARPGKLFTAHSTLMVTPVGTLQASPLQYIIEAVVALLQTGFDHNLVAQALGLARAKGTSREDDYCIAWPFFEPQAAAQTIANKATES